MNSGGEERGVRGDCMFMVEQLGHYSNNEMGQIREEWFGVGLRALWDRF